MMCTHKTLNQTMTYKYIPILLMLTCSFLSLLAQDQNTIKGDHCGTMARLDAKLEHDPVLKASYYKQLDAFNEAMQTKARRNKQEGDDIGGASGAVYTIPVVFHIVLANPFQVSDAQVMEQLKVLNEDFAGNAPDSINIPGYFKPLHGKSKMQFCLAQRTPDGYATTGIDRVITSRPSFSSTNDAVKHNQTGGVDIWDGDKYLNIWICVLSNNVLGYATFPTEGDVNNQGVVVHYQSLPGGTLANYNGGKALTHEVGHYFDLYHIWGDDNGSCSGTDYIDDTPNQTNASFGCYVLKTDACTPGGNGILFQDYMDYSYDQCLLLFTPEQDDRMESALLTYRSSLLTSNACTPVIVYPLDVHLKNILTPSKRICTTTFFPAVTIRNKGTDPLKSLIAGIRIDNGTNIYYTWNGTLATLDTTTIHMNALTVSPGMHTVEFFINTPNGGIDQDKNNDTLKSTLQYYEPVQTVNESFEGNVFPPPGWDIINSDAAITWEKITGSARTGNASALLRTFNYTNTDQQDYMRLPQLELAHMDSAFLSFQVAAGSYTSTNVAGNNWDTLEVLISHDCGLTYNSLYKKWGASLVTTDAKNSFFVPASAAQWRKDSIDLTPYINNPKILLAFRSTNEFENNIYIDDIKIRSFTINPNLKAKGFLVTPNPAKSNIQVQFYPNTADLKSIQIVSSTGQKIAEINMKPGPANNLYAFDLNNYPGGVYFVRAIFSNNVLVQKFFKE